MTEKIEQIVQLQVKAIRNIKIDMVTVWDSASSEGGPATANFLAGLIKSLPPLHDVAGMAGVDLPKYLGEIADKKDDVKKGSTFTFTSPYKSGETAGKKDDVKKDGA
jgi:flotillin